MDKLTVALIFGGVSPEHDISLRSASTVLSHIDKNKYNILPIYITKLGKWLLLEDTDITDNELEKKSAHAILSPDTTHRGLLKFNSDKYELIPIDVIFPVLHGKYGEDGCIQGLFEMSGISYIGCNVLSSAISMDKAYTKLVVASFGITQAKYEILYESDLDNIDLITSKVENNIGYPCFIKPANAGSSVGVSVASDYKSLAEGINNAFIYDNKIIIEEFINGRELECAVIGTKDKKASCVGEVKAAAKFYDFDAKYNNAQSKTIVPADIPKHIETKIRENALIVFNAVSGSGLSRVDFFLEDNTNRIIFNEINTLPGFTSISMYPMLWAQDKIDLSHLIDILIYDAMQA